MLTRQRALYLVLGCAAIAAAAMYFTDNLQAENRPLTDQEMASIFGRQPDPGGIPCNGCYLETVAANCDFPDPCGCVEKGKAVCPMESRVSLKLKTLTRFRSRKPEEDKNQDIKGIDLEDCYIAFPCLTDDEFEKTACSGDGVCKGPGSATCVQCVPDDFFPGHIETIPNDVCLPCPNPKKKD